MPLVSKQEAIQAMKKSGISEEEMNKTMKAIRSTAAMKVIAPNEIEDTIAHTAAKLLGVSVGEKTLKSASGGGDCVKTTIQKILHKEIKEVKVCVSGFVKTIEEGETRSGNRKLSVRITSPSGTSTIKCTIYAECLDIFESLDIKELDKIKLLNAEIFEFEINSYKGVMLTCGKFSDVEKVKGNFTNKLPKFNKADLDNTTFVTGIVSETDQHSYWGCPECKKKYAEKDADECEHCDYEGEAIEYKIVDLAVTQGNLDVVVTIFGSKTDAKDLFGKMVTAVGRKKGSRELTANNIRVEGIGLDLKSHSKHFAEDDKKATNKKKKEQKTKKSKPKNEPDSFKDKVFINTVTDMVQIYGNEGIKFKDLTIGIKARFSSMEKGEIRKRITEMGEHGKLKIKNKIIYSI